MSVGSALFLFFSETSVNILSWKFLLYFLNLHIVIELSELTILNLENGTVMNPALPSLDEYSLEIRHKVPYIVLVLYNNVVFCVLCIHVDWIHSWNSSILPSKSFILVGDGNIHL